MDFKKVRIILSILGIFGVTILGLMAYQLLQTDSMNSGLMIVLMLTLGLFLGGIIVFFGFKKIEI